MRCLAHFDQPTARTAVTATAFAQLAGSTKGAAGSSLPIAATAITRLAVLRCGDGAA